MAEEPIDPRIQRVNMLTEMLFQQGSIRGMLEYASRCMPEGADFTQYYQWCEEYKKVPDERLPAFTRALQKRLADALSGDERAAEIVLDLYGLNEYIRGYIDASIDAAIHRDDFTVRRQSQMAMAGLKACFSALSGVGKHQADMYLGAFCKAADELSQDMVRQRTR